MMNTNNSVMKKIFPVILIMSVIIAACTKEDKLEEASRLFRPVMKDELESNGNWIKASWQTVKGADSYTAEVSLDTFRTIAATMIADTNTVVFEDLGWDKLYQVQVRANAADTSKNSKASSLGAIKTARFPTILNVPDISEVNDNSVKVTWKTGGAAVTSIKVLLASDSFIAADVTLNPVDISNEYKIVSGLNASTNYIIFLYSDATVRGWADFTTKAPLVGSLIDLRGITGNANILRDTIPDVASGSIIILKRGEQYNINSTTNLDKTLTFVAGDDLLNPDKPVIYMPANFNITSGSVIDSIVFNDVILRGSDYNGKYAFNIDQSCNVGKIHFEGCLMEIFRGVLRIKAGTSTYGTISMNNCVVDSVKDYGIINIDVATSHADVIKITNSTIYNIQRFIVSRNNSVSVLVDNCTINEAPLGDNSSYIWYRTSGSDNVTNGITINNCIFGIGDPTSAGEISVRDVLANASTTINASNNYRTSDHVSGGNDFPGIIAISKTTTELWRNPSVGDFKIIDNTFSGRNTSGDPRWRP